MKTGEPVPGEVIAGFLDFLETAKKEYESAYAAVGAEDNKVQTFLHDMDDAGQYISSLRRKAMKKWIYLTKQKNWN